MVSERAPTVALPGFLRRTLGLRTRRRIPFDAAVKLRPLEATWMLTHPADVRHVLVTNAANYDKTRFLSSARGRLRAGEGLLTASGDAHRRQRRLLQPLFHERVVQRFAPVVEERTQGLLDRLGEAAGAPASLDLAEEMAELTRAVIVSALFGHAPGREDASLAAAIRARRRYTQHVYHGRLPFRARLPTRVVREHRRALRVLDDVIAREIAARRRDGPGEDLLSLLMAASYPDGSRMDDRQVRDEVLTLTSTGYETLGEALAWSWLLLARHPAAEARFHAELRAVLGGRPPKAGDVAGLAYTQSVLRESMRIHPPTWIFERVPRQADTLPSGAEVPAGAKLYLCQWVLHRHPRFFPDAEAFRPERFGDTRRRPFRFAYLPFGDGPHTCLGETFAMMQGVLVLARVGQALRFELEPGQRIVPKAGITLGARHGIRARPRWHRAHA
jgi:cytochrome P450